MFKIIEFRPRKWSKYFSRKPHELRTELITNQTNNDCLVSRYRSAVNVPVPSFHGSRHRSDPHLYQHQAWSWNGGWPLNILRHMVWPSSGPNTLGNIKSKSLVSSQKASCRDGHYKTASKVPCATDASSPPLLKLDQLMTKKNQTFDL